MDTSLVSTERTIAADTTVLSDTTFATDTPGLGTDKGVITVDTTSR